MRWRLIIGPAPGPPGPGWRAAWRGRQAVLWTKGPAETSPITDGIRLGPAQAGFRSIGEAPQAWGGFLAVAEDASGVTVYRDPSGRPPAYATRVGRSHLVCSHLEDLAPCLERPLAIDWALVTALLLRNFMPGRRTGFLGVREILPGEALRVEGAAISARLAWSPRPFWSERLRTLEDATAALRLAAEASVGFWAGRFRNILLDLSGGLDSSAVLGLIAALPAPPRLTALNAAAGHAESDERAFARLAAAAAGVPLIEVELGGTPTLYDHAPPFPLQPRPCSQLRGTGLHTEGIAAAAAVGAEAYFTGRGGDHVFYSGVPPLAARDHLLDRRDPAGFLGVAYDLARLTGQPLVRILAEALKPPKPGQGLAELLFAENPFVTPEAAAALDPASFVHPWAEEALEGAPPGKVRQVCLIIELQRHYDRIGRAEVLEEVNPFIAQPLIEASLRTPAYLFSQGGVPRGLQRAVFADLIPEAIRRRRTKGATTAHAVRTLAANLPWMRVHLLEGELVREGLLDRALLEERLNPDALLDARFRPGLAECVSAQLWLERARQTLAATSLAARASQEPTPL